MSYNDQKGVRKMRMLMLFFVIIHSYYLGFYTCEDYMDKKGYEESSSKSTIERIKFLIDYNKPKEPK